MTLQVLPITSEHKDYVKIEKLMQSVFPQEELVPMSILMGDIDLASINIRSSFFSFYEGEQLCGIIYLAEAEKLIYLGYIAVDDRLQSQGYGSKMLTWLKENVQKPLILILEIPNKTAQNAEQRIKRIKFYERNGFTLTGFDIVYNGVNMTAMTTDIKKFSDKEFKNFTEKYWARILSELQK